MNPHGKVSVFNVMFRHFTMNFMVCLSLRTYYTQATVKAVLRLLYTYEKNISSAGYSQTPQSPGDEHSDWREKSH